jgi:hypothetical protein
LQQFHAVIIYGNIIILLVIGENQKISIHFTNNFKFRPAQIIALRFGIGNLLSYGHAW